MNENGYEVQQCFHCTCEPAGANYDCFRRPHPSSLKKVYGDAKWSGIAIIIIDSLVDSSSYHNNRHLLLSHQTMKQSNGACRSISSQKLSQVVVTIAAAGTVDSSLHRGQYIRLRQSWW